MGTGQGVGREVPLVIHSDLVILGEHGELSAEGGGVVVLALVRITAEVIH